jgi:anionic cell wall polymer biosynthesis LytR-Cps2A-Psr (LCP) family protein
MNNLYQSSSRRRKPARKRVFWAVLVVVLLLIGVFLFKSGNIFSFLWNTQVTKQIALKQSPERKINVLLLGVGGGTHDGPDLTDTIIFASVDSKTDKVTLVSLPRDLWMPELNAKVNSAYTYAEEKKPGSGLLYTKALIGKILNQQIDYAIKLDFDGFVKAVDIVGGLDIEVSNAFDDYQYPLNGKEDSSCGLTEDKIASLSAEIASGSASESEAFPCRYEHLHFDKGPAHMEGITALKYVRSRHALGKEGSDFARSKRQEKVISALKQKIFSAGTLLNPVKIVELVNTLKDSLKTDIKEDEYDDFVNLAQKMKGAKISSAVVDMGDSESERLGLLLSPPISPEYGNQWVLSPRTGNGNYSEIQEYVSCQIKGTNCMVGTVGIVTPTPKPTIIPMVSPTNDKKNLH